MQISQLKKNPHSDKMTIEKLKKNPNQFNELYNKYVYFNINSFFASWLLKKILRFIAAICSFHFLNHLSS